MGLDGSKISAFFRRLRKKVEARLGVVSRRPISTTIERKRLALIISHGCYP
jgi:hypothetical protein